MHCVEIITISVLSEHFAYKLFFKKLDFSLVPYVTVTLIRTKPRIMQIYQPVNYMQQTSIGTCYFKHNRLKYLFSVLELETFKSVNVPYVTLSNSLDLPSSGMALVLVQEQP